MAASASSIIKIIAYQVLITFVVSVVFALTLSVVYGEFALIGGVIAVIPTVYLGISLVRAAKLEAKKFINSFYASESIKLILTVFLFFLAFKIPDVKLFPLLTCYVSALSVFWFALLMR